jgi:hypothetical protein
MVADSWPRWSTCANASPLSLNVHDERASITAFLLVEGEPAPAADPWHCYGLTLADVKRLPAGLSSPVDSGGQVERAAGLSFDCRRC